MEIDARLAEEAIRVFRRYAVELVEDLGLCPWARAARREGRVREQVVLTPELDMARTLAAVDTFDASVEIGIILFPRVAVDRSTFEQFVAEVRTHRPAPFAMAEFHPRARAVLDPPGAFTSFVRRTPDPTIQLVRQSALEHVRRGDKNHGSGYFDPAMIETLLAATVEPALHERVLDANRRTIAGLGLAEMSQRFDAIRQDRDASYARLFSRDSGIP